MESSPTKGSLDAKCTIGRPGIEEGILRKVQITKKHMQIWILLSSGILQTFLAPCISLKESWGEASTAEKCGEKTHITTYYCVVFKVSEENKDNFLQKVMNTYQKSRTEISMVNRGENSGVCLRSVHFINTCPLPAYKTNCTCSHKVLQQTSGYYEDRVISLHTASECINSDFFSMSFTSHTTSAVPSKSPRTRAH